jgi:hypothetical protein
MSQRKRQRLTEALPMSLSQPLSEGPTIRGPMFQLVNASLASLPILSHRSGLNSSASSPQIAGSRCASKVPRMIEVFPGMYNGSLPRGAGSSEGRTDRRMLRLGQVPRVAPALTSAAQGGRAEVSR